MELEFHRFHISLGWSFAIYEKCLKFLVSLLLISDPKLLPMSIIDTYFINTLFDENPKEPIRERFMWRYEFLEILVRLAKFKFLESGIWSTLADAVELMITENYIQNSDFGMTWSEWRVNELWNISIDDLFHANIASLRALFSVISI